ncbi:MAG: PAS domain-containing protein, partial [Chloroherpetonaceae bacterium]|nr:PAS domain-containing protein [Chloroherpetonaceae bacterium]
RQTANRLKAEISEKAEREKELMDEIDKAQEAEMQLRIELQDAIITGNELRDAIAKAESQLAQFETIFKQYEAALNAQLSNASALSEQAESAKAELATAQEEKRSLESKLAAAQESARALAERFAIQLDELRAKLAEETENRTRLEQELAEAKRAIEILESTPKGNPEREAKLEAELAEAQRALSHLRADWEQANREVERLENDVKIVEASFQEKSAKLLDLQKRLKAKEKELAEKSAMLDALNLAIVMVNPSGEICYWNESAAVFHGVPAGEALGKKSDDIMKYKYASAKERKSAMESLQSVGRWNGRIKYATPDGEQKTAEVFISRLDDEVGNPLGVLTILNDITKRSAMEADYHRFKQIIEPMLNAVPIALLAFDDAGVIMGVFGKTDELQKLNPTIANGKSIYELYGKYPPLLGAFRRVLSGESFSTTIAAGEASVEFHFSPIVKNGAIAGAVGALLEAEQTVERS